MTITASQWKDLVFQVTSGLPRSTLVLNVDAYTAALYPQVQSWDLADCMTAAAMLIRAGGDMPDMPRWRQALASVEFGSAELLEQDELIRRRRSLEQSRTATRAVGPASASYNRLPLDRDPRIAELQRVYRAKVEEIAEAATTPDEHMEAQRRILDLADELHAQRQRIRGGTRPPGVHRGSDLLREAMPTPVAAPAPPRAPSAEPPPQ